MAEQVHGGVAVARTLETLGVDHLFTLTGGHIFPILDGCRQSGIRIVDTRHEQSAAFAAEGWARLTRALGVFAATAGPGVTNAMSALAQARFNGAPVLGLGGRAPSFRWGQGSLQEIDHVPFVDPIAPARTVTETASIPTEMFEAAADALSAPRGPRFLDFPLDVVFNSTTFEASNPSGARRIEPDPAAIEAVARTLGGAERPVVIAGSNVWLDGAERAFVAFVERARLPAFTNGQGRGCIPADHELAFARSRSTAIKEADVVIVAGTPLDFRLGFGQGFAPGARVVHLESHPDLVTSHVQPAAAVGGDLGSTFDALSAALGAPLQATEWIEHLRSTEAAKREVAGEELRSDASPIHPLRIYGELTPLLDRDAIVIGDGGDFVSFAGREVPSYEPGCWLDPGPFGCLGMGPAYAMAARLAHPDRQVVLLLGDGALGLAGMELESLVRHGLPVTCIVGNNGIWGLEKHPMRALFGYDVAAELRPGIRYDRMMEAFGGRGFLVERPDELAPALKDALACGEPALVNVLTDPAVAYPRSANLA